MDAHGKKSRSFSEVKKSYLLLTLIFILILSSCQSSDQNVFDKTKTVSENNEEKLLTKKIEVPWSNNALWDSIERTKSYADFSAKINDALPKYNFKLVGRLKEKGYFYPTQIEIYKPSEKKPIQILRGKNRFDNHGYGFDEGDLSLADLVQLADINFDGYLDLRILFNTGATGNNWYASYLFNPGQDKFVYHERLSRLSAIRLNKYNKQIVTYERCGWCEEYIGYYRIIENRLILVEAEWTEMDRTRDVEVGGPACFKYTGKPRRGDVRIDTDKFICDYEKYRPYMRKRMTDIKEDVLYGSLDGRARSLGGIPIE